MPEHESLCSGVSGVESSGWTVWWDRAVIPAYNVFRFVNLVFKSNFQEDKSEVLRWHFAVVNRSACVNTAQLVGKQDGTVLHVIGDRTWDFTSQILLRESSHFTTSDSPPSIVVHALLKLHETGVKSKEVLNVTAITIILWSITISFIL